MDGWGRSSGRESLTGGGGGTGRDWRSKGKISVALKNAPRKDDASREDRLSRARRGRDKGKRESGGGTYQSVLTTGKEETWRRQGPEREGVE